MLWIGNLLLQYLVEFIRFFFAFFENLRNGLLWIFFKLSLHAELNLRLSASRNVQFIDGSGLGTCAASKSGGISVREVVIDGVFGRFPLIRDAIKSFSVGFIVAENQFLVTLETENIVPWPRIKGFQRIRVHLGHLGHKGFVPGKPKFTKPDRWQDPKFRCFRTSVGNGRWGYNILCVLFCIFNDNVKIPIGIKYSGIQQFVLVLEFACLFIFIYQLLVGKFRLRILVQHLHVAVGGGRILVEVDFFDVLPMIALVARQSKKSFLQKRIFAIPECPGHA